MIFSTLVTCDCFCVAGADSARDQAPGVFLRDDPICGTQLENQSELRATSADRAAHYLDAAIAARTVPGWSANVAAQLSPPAFIYW